MKPGTQEFVAEPTITVVGVSRTKGFGSLAARALRQRGYQVQAVNAHADEIDGAPCFRSLAALPAPPAAVLVVVPPSESPKVVEECGRLGVKKVWLQQGAESAEALAAAEAAGIAVVHHACILMYARPTGVHRFHAWLKKVTGGL